MKNNQETFHREEKNNPKESLLEGLKFLIAEVYQWMYDMQECCLATPADDQKMLNISVEIKAKIDFFCTSNLKINNPVASPLQEEISSLKSALKEGYSKFHDLRSRLHLKRRRTNKLVKANLRLKREIRRLRINLNRLRGKFGRKRNQELSYDSNSHQDESESLDIELVVERVRGFTRGGVIGGSDTLLAMKNSTSYLVATSSKGLRLVENGKLVYSRKLFGDKSPIRDVIYVPCANCYLLDFNSQLYRKDIDEEYPYLYIDFRCGYRQGAYFRYSKRHQRVIVNKDCKNISVINVEKNKLEIEIDNKIQGDYVNDFRLFGSEEDRVVSVTKNGYIVLYSLDYAKKRGFEVTKYPLDLLKERFEEPVSIAVCERNKFLLLEIAKVQKNNPPQCSRMMLLEVNQGSFLYKASLDMNNQEIGCKLALEMFCCQGNHILWVGLSWNEGFVQVYDYDIEAGQLRELKDKKVSHQEFDPLRLHLLEGKFYYIGKKGRFMELSINFN